MWTHVTRSKNNIKIAQNKSNQFIKQVSRNCVYQLYVRRGIDQIKIRRNIQDAGRGGYCFCGDCFVFQEKRIHTRWINAAFDFDNFQHDLLGTCDINLTGTSHVHKTDLH